MATLNLEKGFESDVEEISSARLEESAQPVKYLNCKHEDVRPTSEHRFKKTKTNIYILDVVVWETGTINQHWVGGAKPGKCLGFTGQPTGHFQARETIPVTATTVDGPAMTCCPLAFRTTHSHMNVHHRKRRPAWL